MATIKMKPVDAVVVGSGVVGSIMSMELANAGLKVLCLERGRMIDPQTDFVAPYVHDELKYDRHSDIFQNLSRETISFRNNMGQTALPCARWARSNRARWWAAPRHWRQRAALSPHDFEIRSGDRRYGRTSSRGLHRPGLGRDLGRRRPLLRPVRAHLRCPRQDRQPGRQIRRAAIREGPRSREYPNPPTRRTPQGRSSPMRRRSWLTPFRDRAPA
jgi:gluconate 2-dehydrogenase alpha chain